MAPGDEAANARPIEAWIVRKTGKAAEDVTIADIRELPRQEHLRYAPIASPLGGRLDRHLEHIDDDDVEELLERGDRFLAETPE